MPIDVLNPSSTTDPRSGGKGEIGGVPIVNRGPTQVLGFSPLTDCLVSTCRYWDADCCYKIPAFAELGSVTGSTPWDKTINDESFFMVQFPSYSTGSTNTSVVTLTLQKLVGSTWTHQAALVNNTYGTYYPFYSLPIYFYTGYNLEWRKVLNLLGEGCYRIYATYGVNGREGCLKGETFHLLEYSCKRAHGTVRMDASLFDGSISDIDRDGLAKISLCGMTYNDSIRFHGFFGYEESDEEKRQIELTDGLILKTRDELIQNFKLITAPLPKWFHDRFKAYGTMADELRVTDYNWNNSDYNIRRKLIVREGGYKPKYKIGSRLSIVEAQFKEGYQDVSRSLCCGTYFTGK